MIDEKEKVLMTTVYLSVEDIKLKKDIQTAMEGKLNNSTIYRRGLEWFRDKYLGEKAEISQ